MMFGELIQAGNAFLEFREKEFYAARSAAGTGWASKMSQSHRALHRRDHANSRRHGIFRSSFNAGDENKSDAYSHSNAFVT
jgi:hypothetical protein